MPYMLINPLDKYGRAWPNLTVAERCWRCGQPDSLGDCTCHPLRFSEVLELGGVATEAASAVDRLCQQARQFAAQAHAGQLYNKRPFTTHLDHVAWLTEKHAAPDEVRIAAYLHDILEDTTVTAEQLAPFGPAVVGLVQAVTDQPGKNRHERHEKTYPGIRAAGSNAVLLKLCDRLANVRGNRGYGGQGLLQMYRKEQLFFEHTLRLPGEHEALWVELATSLRE